MATSDQSKIRAKRLLASARLAIASTGEAIVAGLGARRLSSFEVVRRVTEVERRE
jgi:hypothetical protein